ncbi:hypothetical protein ASG69_04720 [Rhodococcus sp. Leaf225]|nr:hypothetical protein ASG69_04720 [Rhodococcus sp. Leaf225]KQU44731.1 hypothetical protein ASH03_12420 [Rhodococcus sp. Leaf258]
MPARRGQFARDNSSMTTPNPGWYSDPNPANAGGQRYWDGGQWTNQATPSTSPGAGAPQPPAGGNRGLRIFLAIAAGIVLLAGIGSLLGLGQEDDEGEEAAAVTTTRSAPRTEGPISSTGASVVCEDTVEDRLGDDVRFNQTSIRSNSGEWDVRGTAALNGRQWVYGCLVSGKLSDPTVALSELSER